MTHGPSTADRPDGPSPPPGPSPEFEVAELSSELLRRVASRPGLDSGRRSVRDLLRFLDADPTVSAPPGSPAAPGSATLETVHGIRVALLDVWEDDPTLSQEDLRLLLQALADVEAHLRSDALSRTADALEAEGGMNLVVELAHDLRSPLGSILFLSDTLRQGRSGAVNELQEEQLGLIYRAALALVSTANDVMDLARSGRGLVSDDPEPFSISELFSSIDELLSPMAHQKGVELRLDNNVPDPVVGYGPAVGRVLVNLATNALKFTESGYVRVSAEEIVAGHLEFAVRDTGRGIPEDAQKHLFDAIRTDSTGERGTFFSRSGLGLGLARRLVREMGSELHFETRKGWGTRFYFELPLEVGARPSEAV